MDVFNISIYDMAIPINMSSLVFLLGYWILSMFITTTLNYFSNTFKNMELRHKRNIIQEEHHHLYSTNRRDHGILIHLHLYVPEADHGVWYS